MTADHIVLDEVGFVPLHKDAAELLFQIIADCYERQSLIITSNLEFSQWNTVFGDNRLTAALMVSPPGDMPIRYGAIPAM